MKIKYHLQALLVTFLWSTSFIIIKSGLKEIPPVLFAGIRYFFAFLIMLPFLFTRENINYLKTLSKSEVRDIMFLGVIFYTLTQGLLFLGLSYLQSSSVSLILNFTPVVVGIFSGILLKEKVSGSQWLGIILFFSGCLVYFLPQNEINSGSIGIIIMLIAVFSNAGSALLGRKINRNSLIPPIIITSISMGAGSVILFFPSLLYFGIPEVSTLNILLLLWMAAVNTAAAFILWNNCLKYISAAESSIINSTMLFQVTILGYIFLGEIISLYQFSGMLVALSGAVMVQLFSIRKELKPLILREE